MGYPEFSPFPVDEYEQRLKRARGLMERQGLDGLLVTAKENVVYFTGLQTIGWDSKYRPVGAVIPRDGAPVLVIPRSLTAVSRATSWVTELQPWGGSKDPAQPKNAIQGMCAALRDLDLADKRIGMELGEEQRIGMSQNELAELLRSVPGLEPCDAADLIWDLRMIKSPREIAVMRTLCDATCKALEAGLVAAREGMTERELAGIIMAEMARLTGHRPGFIGIRSGPVKYPMVNVPPFVKPLEKGDLALVDVGATLNDYWSDMMRMLSVGGPTEAQKRFYDVEVEAEMAGVDAMRPGATAGDVCRACLDVIKKRGLGMHAMALDRVGHGLGLDMHEPPSMMLGSDRVLEPGMILTSEPIFSDAPEYRCGNFGVEDIVLITETGHEVLTPLSKELRIIQERE